MVQGEYLSEYLRLKVPIIAILFKNSTVGLNVFSSLLTCGAKFNFLAIYTF